MQRFRRTLSFRLKRKKSESFDGSKPQQWVDDEGRIKDGSCSFRVKYLGTIEVYEPRGMQVCEEAIKALRKAKKKPQKAILHVRGDTLRVSDDLSRNLIIDQTIEKVSFCAPDRSHDKGFAYICRDGATKRWMCHAFLAVKDSGERLSHAVGCAFAICLERKQQRERDALQLTISKSDDQSKFGRAGSARPPTLADRLIDPQSVSSTERPTISSTVAAAIITPTLTNVVNRSATLLPGAIPRPRGNPSIVDRQGSLRLFPKLQTTSLFKRDLSLRLEDLPSNLKLLARITNGNTIQEETSTDLSSLLPTHPNLHPLAESLPDFDTSPHQVNIKKSSFPPLSQGSSPPPFFATQNGLTLTTLATTSSLSPSTIRSSFQSPGFLHTKANVNTGMTSVETGMLTTFFTDPFSAAPFNPATIQQYQAQRQKQLAAFNNTCAPAQSIMESGMLSVTAPLSTPTSPASSIFRNPVTFPTPVSSNDKSWLTTLSHCAAVPVSTVINNTPATHLNHFNSVCPPRHENELKSNYWTIPHSVPTSPWTTGGTNNWRIAPVPPLLPPEPNPFSDPFDLGWTDRVSTTNAANSSDCSNSTIAQSTQHFSGQVSIRKPGNPFLDSQTATSGIVSNPLSHKNSLSDQTNIH